MHYRPFHWQLSQRASRRGRLKLWQVAVSLLLLLLLGALHQQLSHWDGLVEPLPAAGMDNMPAAEVGAFARLWLEYGYNAWLAERIPVRRGLLDMRDDRCLEYSYPKLSALMEPRCPQQRSRQAFRAYVQRYIHGAARIFHLEEHVGLVRARRLAADEAKLETLIFLDAHVEVSEGWLEPLLAAIWEDQFTLATPQLDRLDEETLEYVRVVERRGLFDWSLRRREVPLTWQQIKQLPRPFATAVLRTSVFAINAEWFNKLAHLDMELNAPAAAELELSFKVWRIGGRVLQVPCSRVAHLQPSDLGYMQRYGDLQQMAREHFSSYKRLTEIWLSEPRYKSVVYQHQPQILQAHLPNVSKLQELIKRVDFESFDWYLQHVATDLLRHFPLLPRIDLAHGTLRPAHLPSHCLTADLQTRRIHLQPCNAVQQLTQNWTLSSLNDLRLGVDICAEVQPTQYVALSACHTLGGRQSWRLDMDKNYLISNRHCLEFNVRMRVYVRRCDYMNQRQMWFFEHTNVAAIKTNDL
ncbi:putative inactive polypeptide N-acetylgalactosaminyltransferase 12 [Drosophila montana]|uniref:putative inactive polypeptide N-acetylgalactosaminyltransferase 12 n=1 Tax=Drosophila montana TaxID=40370 RepID=UPI00313D0F49